MEKGLATMVQVDALERAELRRFAQRADYNRSEREKTMLADALLIEREKRRQERDRHRREINGMAAFIGVAVFLTVMAACLLSSEKWTATLAILCAVAVMRKAGWLR